MSNQQEIIKCWKCGEPLEPYLVKLFKAGKIGPYCDSCAYEMEQKGMRF